MKQKQAPMRGVFERPPDSGIWWINYYDSAGRRHRERIGRYSVAVEAYLQRRQEVREGRFTPPRAPAGLTFKELAELALADKKQRLTHQSYKLNKWLCGKICRSLGSVPSRDVTSAVVEETLHKYREEGLGGSATNHYRSFISSVFAFAIRTGKSQTNPCKTVPKYKESDPRVRFLLAPEEERLRKTIREFCPDREPELDLTLHTGMRRGEQFQLLREHVDLERAQLTVHGKTGRRYIPINSVARQALEILLRRSSGQNVIAERKDGKQRDWRRWFEWCILEAKVPNFTWHDLRHTFASRLVMAGVDLRTVQELLGHKSILMTMRYAHLAPSHVNAAVEKIVPESKPQGAKRANLQVVAGTQMAPKKERSKKVSVSR